MEQYARDAQARHEIYADTFGFWPIFTHVVKTGYFNRPDLSAIEAARAADFYTFLKFYVIDTSAPPE